MGTFGDEKGLNAETSIKKFGQLRDSNPLRARLESEERGAIRIGKGDLVKEFSGNSDEDEENIRKIEHMLR